MVFVTMFLNCQNVHLIKDPGMIPFYLYKKYGWDCRIACYKDKAGYPYLENEVSGLKLDFVPRKYKNILLDGLSYIKKHAHEIDILHLFHVQSIWNFFWADEYLKRNPKGKIYLKLDTDFNIRYQQPLGKRFPQFRLKRMQKFALISAESESTVEVLRKMWGENLPIRYIPNGFFRKKSDFISYDEKENIILHVARMGTEQKDTETLLEGFYKFKTECCKGKNDWKLRLVGSIETDFRPKLAEFIENHREIKNDIEYIGCIENIEELEKQYKKAKVFVLSSRWESFGIAAIEAQARGCYLILSDFPVAFDLVQWGKYGKTYAIEDSVGLCRCLEDTCFNDGLLSSNCLQTQQYAMKKYDWETIVETIYMELVDIKRQETQ